MNRTYEEDLNARPNPQVLWQGFKGIGESSGHPAVPAGLVA
jgi:hypothetical protein